LSAPLIFLLKERLFSRPAVYWNWYISKRAHHHLYFSI